MIKVVFCTVSVSHFLTLMVVLPERVWGGGEWLGGVNHVNVSKALLTFSRLRAQMIISIYRHIEMTTHAIHREVFLEDYYCGP